jgi:hypothetical protein
MTSSFMPTPLNLAADVIPESIFGGIIRNCIQTCVLAELVEGQSPVEATVIVERLIQATVGDYAPIDAEPAVRQPIERSGAVRTESVIPARCVVQIIDRFNVIKKGAPQLLRIRFEVIQKCLLGRSAFRAAQDDIPFVCGDVPGTLSILLGKGDGTFQPAVTQPTGLTAGGVAVGDFNGDGILDLAVAIAGNGTLGIFLGNGDGTFQPAGNYPAGQRPD